MTADTPKELALAQAIINRLVQGLRKRVLAHLTTAVVTLVQDLGFHLSDFLLALARYVQAESDTDPATEITRTTVSSLLEAAATEAETPGRQLP